jgi:hypothetical protein
MRVLAIGALLLMGAAASSSVRWHQTFVGTQAAARKSGKPILALFWAEW